MNIAKQQICCSFATSATNTSLYLFNTDGYVVKFINVPHNAYAMFGDVDHYHFQTTRGLLVLDCELRSKWDYGVRSYIRTSPACATDGSIFLAGSDQKLYKVDETGNKLWEKANYQAEQSLLSSSPAVDGAGDVYLGDSGSWYFHAVKADATEKWNCKTAWSIHSSPAIDVDGTLYVNGDMGSVYSISSAGSLLWSESVGDVSWPSPALSPQGSVFIPHTTALRAFQQDGAELWSIEGGTGALGGHAAVGDDGTVYFASVTDVIAVSPAGVILWDFAVEPIGAGTPRIVEGAALSGEGAIVFACQDGRMFKLSPAGSLVWQYQAPAGINSTPALDGEDTVYCGCVNGKFIAINADGTLKWEYQAGGPVYASPAIGNDGSILFGADDGYFYALGPGAG